jgi:hypothetical protein
MINLMISFESRYLSSLLAVVLSSCATENSKPDPSTESSSNTKSQNKVNNVAARVDSIAISTAEVASLVISADGRLSAKEALDVLVRHRLLAAEARRRGFRNRPEVAAAEKAAKARALLEDRVGRGVNSENIDDKTLRNEYKNQRHRFVHDTQRRVAHCVALTGKKGLSPQAAKALAEKTYAAVQGAEDENAFVEAAKRVITGMPEAKVERLPIFERTTTRFVVPFVTAAFSVPEVGGVSRPFQTEFGWHVLFVAEEIPASNKSFEAVRELLAEELLPKERREAVGALMTRLLKESKPFIYEDALNFGSKEP